MIIKHGTIAIVIIVLLIGLGIGTEVSKHYRNVEYEREMGDINKELGRCNDLSERREETKNCLNAVKTYMTTGINQCLSRICPRYIPTGSEGIPSTQPTYGELRRLDSQNDGCRECLQEVYSKGKTDGGNCLGLN